MNPAAIVELLLALLQFPKEILQLVRFLKKTPEEKRAEAVKHMSDAMDSFEKTGRPTWS